MPPCPRCSGPLRLDHGVLRDEHGIFVPGSELRRSLNPSAGATMRASLARAVASSLACPGCLSTLQGTDVELPDQPPLSFMACVECDGWWFDAPELARLRAAILAKPVQSLRRVGGYGGHTLHPTPHVWMVPEAIHALLREHIA